MRCKILIDFYVGRKLIPRNIQVAADRLIWAHLLTIGGTLVVCDEYKLGPSVAINRGESLHVLKLERKTDIVRERDFVCKGGVLRFSTY